VGWLWVSVKLDEQALTFESHCIRWLIDESLSTGRRASSDSVSQAVENGCVRRLGEQEVEIIGCPRAGIVV